MSDPLTQSSTPSNPTAAKTQRTPLFYRPELDVLRFAAFFVVFLFHLLPEKASRYRSVHSLFLKDLLACVANSMAFGVCLFFLLSAFLITTLLLQERQATSTVDLPSFYKRRILRIWPLYFLVLAMAFSACTLVHSFPGFSVIAAYLLMSGNLLSHLHLSGDIRPLKIFHLWSISVEEQFYIVFPAIARVVRVKLFPIFSLTLTLVAIFTLIRLAHGSAGKEDIWQNSLVQFMMFGAGIGIAGFFFEKPLPRFANSTRTLVFLVGLSLCFSAQYFCRIGGEGSDISASHAVTGYLLVMAGCSALLIATIGYSGNLPKPLISLGKRSYGLYVFHVWCISLSAFLISSCFHIPMTEGTGSAPAVLAKDLLALALSIAFAALSYRFIEKPFLKLKSRFGQAGNRKKTTDTMWIHDITPEGQAVEQR